MFQQDEEEGPTINGLIEIIIHWSTLDLSNLLTLTRGEDM